jgi:hypothetical protein
MQIATFFLDNLLLQQTEYCREKPPAIVTKVFKVVRFDSIVTKGNMTSYSDLRVGDKSRSFSSSRFTLLMAASTSIDSSSKETDIFSTDVLYHGF